MSISSTVATLARALSPHAPTELQAFVAKLGEMPAYVDRARLDLWETELNAMAVKGDSPAHAAATAIAELGKFNMYGAIDEEETPVYLDGAIAALTAAGVTAPGTDFDLSDW